MATMLNILIVEDSADDTDLLVIELRRAGYDLKWKRVETEENFRANLNAKLDVIFADFTLPKFSTARALELLLESKMDIPFIIVSGTIGEERAVESMKAGATDYVLKDRPMRLGLAVKHALREVQERAEHKRIEAQFIEAQKMEGLGHLASGVAHDFNNLLGVIIGYCDLMTPGLGTGNLQQKCAGEIRQAAERAVGLTQQLLLFSRKQTVQPVVLDLNETVGNMEKILRRLIDENSELAIIPGKQIGRIKADPGQIGQVLMNLVINARDAMPHGGKVTIETANVTLDKGFVATHADATAGEYVRLAITDTGAGMSDEVRAHLFEVFFTTKPKGKGTGLGLSTCQTIIKQSGGYIEVQSGLGAGTTFNVYFPQVDQPLHITPPVRAQPLARGTETLLLVEDELSVRNLARDILEWQGYTILHANNGQEGLRVAREYKGGPIHLVITDVIMPHMNGTVMADWLKVIYPALKILFTSGYAGEAIFHEGGLEPGVAFLPKPYTQATLLGKVREILDH
jgi:signal transduction histidine kinase